MVQQVKKTVRRAVFFGLGVLSGIIAWVLWQWLSERAARQAFEEQPRQALSMPPMPLERVGPAGQAGEPLPTATTRSGAPVIGEELEGEPEPEALLTIVDIETTGGPVALGEAEPLLNSGEEAQPAQPVYTVDTGLPPLPRRDNFTLIEGVDPPINELLHSAGIDSFAELAAADLNQLVQILNDAELPAVDPATWPRQAGLAAAGNWAELDALQNELLGGRPRGYNNPY